MFTIPQNVTQSDGRGVAAVAVTPDDDDDILRPNDERRTFQMIRRNSRVHN